MFISIMPHIPPESADEPLLTQAMLVAGKLKELLEGKAPGVIMELFHGSELSMPEAVLNNIDTLEPTPDDKLN